jgi:hypothetical protein
MRNPEPRWWTPPARRDPNDRRILRRRAELDEAVKRARYPLLQEKQVCPFCRRKLP